MPSAPTVRPGDFFSAEEWALLSRRSAWRGPWMIAHAWGVILAAMALFTLWPNPLTWLLAVMLVGARQLGLAILMHDAAHMLLAKSARWNDWLGQWLCAAPVGADLTGYRKYHFAHHRYTQQPEDPDLTLSAPFPIPRASLHRKIIRDLTGQTFFKQRAAAIAMAMKGQTGPAGDTLSNGTSRAAIARFLGFNLLFGAACAAAGAGWAYLLVWLTAMATWFPLVTRIRNIAEHACVTDDNDPLRHARTVEAGLIERALIAPYHVHYHAEHHMFAQLPCYRLAGTHAALKAKGWGGRIETKRSYAEVLRLAAPHPPPAAQPAD